MTAGTYSFELELLKADYAAFGRYLALHRAPVYARNWAIFASVGAVIIAVSGRDLPFALVAASAWFVAMTALSWYLIRRAPIRLGAATASSTGPYRLTIAADGISTVSATTSVHRSWLAFSDIVERNGLLILSVSPAVAQFVPRRIAANDEQWESLVRDVRTWWQSELTRVRPPK